MVNRQPIAIVGSACRFPGESISPSKLWDLLKAPHDVLKEVPESRFNWKGIYRPDGAHGATRTMAAYWLDQNISHFDCQFFGITPVEASTMDPQHRLLLETVYEALESSGMAMEQLHASDTGVFVGMMRSDYADLANKDFQAASGQTVTTGVSRSIASNRVSYCFNWRGPSMTIDTACSSSLVAVHQAVSALRLGQTSTAFACGTSLNIASNEFVALSKMNMLSPDGRSKMWDESVNGYGKGEGIAVVVLKTLDAAIADGDHIECVIREICTNQDGRTPGITMPSAIAQADLIRMTYAKAGLDPTKKIDRPQFFEAHGTGTPAGDPQEAQAVASAFFPSDKQYPSDEVLHIGSIKTIIGHTEGTAGIAGLMKASLALQHGVLPPNLLFRRMNPKVAPFTEHLRLVTSVDEWPMVPHGSPRRASVNSFGFGGSNVHVILESYGTRETIRAVEKSKELSTYTPFTFTGPSQRALLLSMENYLAYLDAHIDVRLQDLLYTMQSKRSQFAYRRAISAPTVDILCQKLMDAITTSREQTSTIDQWAKPEEPRILAVFTGQGAQWPKMGKDLIKRSQFVRNIVERLDASLSQLSEADRPSWTIEEELTMDATRSRIHQASLAQPLATAIQIVLVELLKVAGVKLHAVVGHSSGEIGAAYAAGYITASDAIRIAYYRGFHAYLAKSKNGKDGAMFAAFMPPQEAMEFCRAPQFKDRLCIGAFNSPKIVTLSGDVDAIDEAKTMLDEMGYMTRMLKTDKAYHSHHMQSCVVPYRQSLAACDISVLVPEDHFPQWFSTVYSGDIMCASNDLAGEYWVQNLMKPVMFMEGITKAMDSKKPPNMIVEVGSHPVLLLPLKDILHAEIPYSSLLKRDTSDTFSFSEALGVLWTNFSQSTINFAKYEALFSDDSKPAMLIDLPTYRWDHDREFWWDSRLIREYNTRCQPPVELLGSHYPSSGTHEHKWRAFLSPEETIWLNEHKLSGVPVLPGAAYVVMACEAAIRLAKGRSIDVIELQDFTFERPIVFDDEDTVIETILTASHVVSNNNDIQADIVVDFASAESTNAPLTATRAKILISFEDSFNDRPSLRVSRSSRLTTIDPEDFYNDLSELGFGYSGPFRCITTLCRRLNYAEGRLKAESSELLFHPAILDGLLQAFYATLNYPGDSALPKFPVPSSIGSLKVFPSRCKQIAGKLLNFDISSSDNETASGSIYGGGDDYSFIQMEKFATKPFSKTTDQDDITMFSEMVWRPAFPNGEEICEGFHMTKEQKDRGESSERLALFYLKNLSETITEEERSKAQIHHQYLLDYADDLQYQVRQNLDPTMHPEWLSDTEQDIQAVLQKYPNSVELRIMHNVGMGYPSIIRGETHALEHLMKDGLLNEYYQYGLGFPEANAWTSNLVKLISHRYPNADIMEVGGGTGGATAGILNALEMAFSSYTFTDVSPAFLTPAEEKFAKYTGKMSFKVFDMELPISSQGFEENNFDGIVASNVLHASADVSSVLSRLRSLLRPGGFLVCLELADSPAARDVFIMGGLPGWWLGHGNGRRWSPAFSQTQWDGMLKSAGFSGLDVITPPKEPSVCHYKVFATQAIDQKISLLREPMTYPAPGNLGALLIIHGEFTENRVLAQQVSAAISAYYSSIKCISSLADLHLPEISIAPTVLCLSELQEPVFRQMTGLIWKGLRRLFKDANTILWLTCGCRDKGNMSSAYANMMTGFGRTVCRERTDLRLQFIDVGKSDFRGIPSRIVSEALLRWSVPDQWLSEEHSSNMLWSNEPELAMVHGRLFIPRVIASQSQNDRLNSQHRTITETVDARTCPVEVLSKNACHELSKAHQVLRQSAEHGYVRCKLLYSTLIALKVKSNVGLYLGLGIMASGQQAVIFTESNASLNDVSLDLVFPHNPSRGTEKSFLATIAIIMVAERLLSKTPPKGCLAVVTSDPAVITVISYEAMRLKRRLVFVTTENGVQAHRAIHVHPHDIDDKIKESLPTISVLANLASNRVDDKLFARLTSLMPRSTKVMDKLSLFGPGCLGLDDTRQYSGKVKELAALCLQCAEHTPQAYRHKAAKIVKFTDLGQSINYTWTTLIDWQADSSVPVPVEQAGNTVTFRHDRTYLSVGTSDLAQSICEWMVSRGARYIVLGSRSPPDLGSWAQEMSKKGATISARKMDITDKQALRTLFNEIRKTWPPIAGVMNLSLILRDGSFSNIPFADLQAVTAPKVQGSLNLHELTLDDKLDFFIMASSICYTIGNPGQANYSAANGFMVGLTTHRRKMGLPGTVIDLGRVTGIGYIFHSKRKGVSTLTKKDLEKQANYPISEQELHQIFAEAVLASPADSGISPEIITGLRYINPSNFDRAPWGRNPMFSHMILHQQTQKMKRETQIAVREQLKKANDKATVRGIIAKAFLRRLTTLLHENDNHIKEHMKLLELGVDSLVATEIGTWFRKEMGTAIPHEKIFGSSNLTELIDFAVEKIDLKMTGMIE